jgi:hypothetical protein
VVRTHVADGAHAASDPSRDRVRQTSRTGWCNGAMQHVRVPPLSPLPVPRSMDCAVRPGRKPYTHLSSRHGRLQYRHFPAGGEGEPGIPEQPLALPGLRRRVGASRAATTSRHLQGNRSDESACPRAGAVAACARNCRRAARAARGAAGSVALPAARASGGEDRPTPGHASRGGFASARRSEADPLRSALSASVPGVAAQSLPAWHVQANAQGHARGGASRFVRGSPIARALMP